jgi:hypothetical protein
VKMMRGVITRQVKRTWTVTAHRVAVGVFILLALRLVVMVTSMHMADAPMVTNASEVSMTTELPPACLLGAGNCSLTVATPADQALISVPIEVGLVAPPGSTAPQLFEAPAHGPPRRA